MGAPKASAQELAWNMGTMASTEAAAVRPHASAMDMVNDCRKFERCEYSTPCSAVLFMRGAYAKFMPVRAQKLQL